MIYTFIREGKPTIGVPAAKFLERFQNTPIPIPCPRVGELVSPDGDAYTVTSVLHTPQHDSIMAVIHVESAQ